MGTSSAKIRESGTCLKSPEFYWLHKSENAVFRINEESVTSHNISSLSLFENCAVGYADDCNIIVAGGVKVSGMVSKKVFYINVANRSINRLCSLKFPSAGCSLLSTQNKLFLIPGSLSNPLQHYNSGEWSIITPTPLNLTSTVHYFHDSILYFLCGMKPNLKPTKKIYTLSLVSPTEYKKSGKRTPFKLENPILVKVKSQIIVAGGKTNGKPNYRFFISNIECEKWKVIEGPGIFLTKSPGICVKNSAIWVEFPKIVVFSGLFFSIWNIIDGKVEQVDNKGKKLEKNRKEKKLKFKNIEYKDKKIVEKKNKLEKNVLNSMKINSKLYLRAEEIILKEVLDEESKKLG